MTNRRSYVIALAATSLALLGSMGAATAYAVNASSTPSAQPAAVAADWNDGPGWMMDPDTMMGDTWTAPADIAVTADQARAKAQAWITAREPGARLGDAVTVPMGYRFPVTLNSTTIGVVMVDGTTGRVTGHAVTGNSTGWADNWHPMMGQNWNNNGTVNGTGNQNGWGGMMDDWSNGWSGAGWGGMMR
jgi:hypothetical protein